MILDRARKVHIQLTIKQLKHKCLYEIISTEQLFDALVSAAASKKWSISRCLTENVSADHLFQMEFPFWTIHKR